MAALEYHIKEHYFILNGSKLGGDRWTYSGNGTDKNKINFVNVPNKGAIPPGTYTIVGKRKDEPGRKSLGADSLVLRPKASNKMYGRSHFLIHGGNGKGTASDGCIVTLKSIREKIWASSIRTLEVVK
jgi:hypothetical protein